MKKHFISIFLFLFSNIIFAQSSQSFPFHNAPTNLPGFYLDAGLGTIVAHADFFDKSFTQSGGFAGVLFLGYKLNSYFAIEGGAISLSSPGSSDNVVYFPAAFKGILSLGEQRRLKLFMKLGSVFANSSAAILLGVGVGYAIRPNLELATEINSAGFFPVDSLSPLTINLIYHFG